MEKVIDKKISVNFGIDDKCMNDFREFCEKRGILTGRAIKLFVLYTIKKERLPMELSQYIKKASSTKGIKNKNRRISISQEMYTAFKNALNDEEGGTKIKVSVAVRCFIFYCLANNDFPFELSEVV